MTGTPVSPQVSSTENQCTETEFTRLSRDLEQRLAETQNLVDTLNTRLAVVSSSEPRPESPNKTQPVTPTLITSPLGHFLFSQTERVKYLNTELEILIADLRV